MKRDDVDLFLVPDKQAEIHKKLMNWAMWAKPGYGSKVHPMWKRVGRPHYHAPEVRDTCDTLAATKMEKAVRELPEKHAFLIRWWYVWQWPEMRVRRELGMTKDAIHQATIDARQMLINRRI